ncbi:hybrid sensor histidine kinase/response regulator [Desulfovibrio legallii]|uniref:histidine kinase n=1 Tax=Desulfovibrio legallii TaxID=571438 RepID=A0A1G7JJP8_9BACT|nr:response regulator [Desulfovibrio legallii]SDF25123.1 His Kinase A (phospho-acceptor) domain-containing protein [Desulfovibrio legallii]
MRVLIVDDEAAFAHPLAERLRLRGVDATTAADAPAALDALAAQERDLIFLDVGLPGMDGVTLLKVLHEKYPRTDVVMLSGAADMGKAVQAMRRGALNWLSKPVSLEDVLAECRKAGERAQAREEAARLAEAARWRSLGRVAEGVAHEVNNPLNIIVQAAGLVRDCLDAPEAASLPEVDEAREAVALIRVQSLRVREITRKLLMVGHGLDPRTGPLDVGAALDAVLELLHSRLEQSSVQCRRALPQDAARPLGSAPELHQILLHLLENALDAMPDGGTLSVRGELRRDAQERDWYDVLVEDSGPGISAEVMPHIFEPFFSTRTLQSRPQAPDPAAGQAQPLGRYAGLGLAVARSLAQARGGELTAANRPEGGAVFRLSLPLAE